MGRTQTNGASDYDHVHAFQRGMRLLPLSQFPGQDEVGGSTPTNGQPPAGPTPPDRIEAMDPIQFFTVFTKALKLNSPHSEDAPMMKELARIGIVAGQDLDASKFTPDQLVALSEGAQAAVRRLEAFVSTGAARKPGWTSFQGAVGRYGINYMARAITARIAIGANPAEDAVYMSNSTDAAGQPMNGSMRYRMHFAASELPSVLAFWSVTGYDKDGYFIANPINRYAIGDRDQLKFNADGSLDLLIQAEDPGPEHQSNWLPSGDGIFNLTKRLYWPKPGILDGGWHPSVVERLP